MKKKKWSNLLIAAGMALIMVLLLAGCGPTDSGANNKENGQENTGSNPDGGQIAPHNGPTSEAEVQSINLYFMKVTDNSFLMDKESREISGPVTPEKLMTELLKGPEQEGLSRVIPDGTKLLHCRVEKGTAYVDLSREIADAYYSGETEGILINSIVWTLTGLEEIEAVQLLVEGEVIESLGGHYSIEKPLTRE